MAYEPERTTELWTLYEVFSVPANPLNSVISPDSPPFMIAGAPIGAGVGVAVGVFVGVDVAVFVGVGVAVFVGVGVAVFVGVAVAVGVGVGGTSAAEST